MVKKGSKAFHANEIKANAPFSRKIKKMEEKGKPRHKRPGNFKSLIDFDVSGIKNKQKRQDVLFRREQEIKKARKITKKENRYNPDRVKQDPLTIDDKRELDENFIFDEDEELELQQEEQFDEFEEFFKEERTPKIMITTSERPSRQMFDFLKDVKGIFGPETYYWPRKRFSIKEIQQFADKAGYSDLLVFREDKKIVTQLLLIHLPKGPSYKFKLTNFTPIDEIHHHARISDHNPELILNNFNTKIGRRVGRCLSSLFPQNPDFKGRKVATFHNQRDFIFFRHHRYMFQDDGNKCALQEIGPRFTLQLKQLKLGTFDEQSEIEFEAKDNLYVKRTKAYL